MTGSGRPADGAARQEMIEHLRELVSAIDKRTWHLSHPGDAAIARDAAALREKALERIAELEAGGS